MRPGDLVRGNMEIGCVFLYEAGTFKTLSQHGPSTVGVVLDKKMMPSSQYAREDEYVKVLMEGSTGWTFSDNLKVIE